MQHNIFRVSFRQKQKSVMVNVVSNRSFYLSVILDQIAPMYSTRILKNIIFECLVILDFWKSKIYDGFFDKNDFIGLQDILGGFF